MSEKAEPEKRSSTSWAVIGLWHGLGLWVALEYVGRQLIPAWQGSASDLAGVWVKSQQILGLVVLLLLFVVLHQGWRSVCSMPSWQTPVGSPAVAPMAFPMFPTPQVGAVVLVEVLLLLAGVAIMLPISDPREWQQALLMALMAGLGASIATILGYLRHASEEKDFELAFAPWYVARPFIGVLLGLLFFFVVKGGILVVLPQLDAPNGKLNTYGLAAIGGTVGMFSKNAVEKLRKIFNVLFQTKDGVQKELLGRLPAELQEKVRPFLQAAAKTAPAENAESAVDREDV